MFATAVVLLTLAFFIFDYNIRSAKEEKKNTRTSTNEQNAQPLLGVVHPPKKEDTPNA
jgi:hypothetical protein